MLRFIIMIRPYYILILVISFCVCGSLSRAKNVISVSKNRNVQSGSVSFDSVCLQNDSILQTKSAIVDGEKYTAFVVFNINKEKREFYIKNSEGQKVFSDYDFVENVQFTDFDGDGKKDVLLDRRGVDSGSQDLVLYDPKIKKFKFAGNCSNAQKIKHSKYYYTYEDCCMGRDWSSDLFFISNFKIINVGRIKYDDGEGLSFYRVNGRRKVLKKKWNVRINGDTPVTSGRHIDFDLGAYWVKNYVKYIGE